MIEKAEWDKRAHYIGVKIVEANPAKRNGVDGYAVTYPDGYVSWSPKNVFEKAYLKMGDDPTKITQGMVNEFIGKIEATQIDDKTTLVKAETITGFVQYETSSCVDPANFDMNIGTNICLERIRNTMWKCLGFVLQWGRFGVKGGVNERKN